MRMARGWRGRKDDDENDAEEERARVWDAKTTRRAGVDTARRVGGKDKDVRVKFMRRIPSDRVITVSGVRVFLNT